MSLINEALKRCERDKLRNSSPYFNNLTLMMPEGDDVPPPPRPTFAERRPPHRPTSRLLLVALAAAACFGAWYLWGRSSGQVGPATAAGQSAHDEEWDEPLTPAQIMAMAERSAPDPSLDRNNTDGQARGNAASTGGAKGGITAGNVEDAFKAALLKLQQARENELEESAGQAGKETSSATDSPETGRAPSTTPAAAPAVPAAPPAPAAPARPAEAKPTPTKPAPAPSNDPDFSNIRITAILRGPDGNVALINGGLYREGQTIQGALIVKIGQHEVEVVANGKRFTIRI